MLRTLEGEHVTKKKRSLAKESPGPQKGPVLVPGFSAAGIHGGIKQGRRRDLALIASDPPARVAGLFTQNRVKAAPVLISQSRARTGLCRAVLINSGNANACTGDPGLKDAIGLCQRTAKQLAVDEHNVLIASTGVIGQRLPVYRIRKALPRLIQRVRPEGLLDAAEAIRTTDRFRKVLWSQAAIGRERVTLCGIAKGAGMIRPHMATMLAFFLTDLKAPIAALRRLLQQGAERSFNRICVDGDMSTNDTVLLLANGRAGNRSAKVGSAEYDAFAALLFSMMYELAAMIVQDGEGATKVVDLRIRGAQSDEEARKLAYHLATSPLVKTSFYGRDPNWGRLMAALGCAGPWVHAQKINIFYDRVCLVRNGVGQGKQRTDQARKILGKDSFAITIDLNVGKGSARVLTSDLTHDYVTLNASYPS
jgi:glutamate N-acetyltransferase/amino-acid N-acetyltransferase